MKVKHIEIEATPAELESSTALAALLAALTSRDSSTVQGGATPHAEPDHELQETDVEALTTSGVADDAVPGVPPEGQAAVKAQLASNPAAQQFRAFLAEAITWQKVGVHGVKPKGSAAGAPLDYSRYLRLRKRGSQLGGFVYTRPTSGTINIRLAFDSDEQLHAIAPDAERLFTGHRAYRVLLRIVDDKTLKQALTLARMAYDRT